MFSIKTKDIYLQENEVNELKAYISKNKTSINFNKILDLELKNELFLTNKKLHEIQSNLK